MKILWITNCLFPEATAKLNGQTEIKGTGGWLLSLAEVLSQSRMIDLTVACITPLVKELTTIQGERIGYYAIPYMGNSTYKKQYEATFRYIYEMVRPNVVHVHGTEYPHSLAALRACGAKNTVISIQGMASVISRYYLAGLSYKDILCKPTLHDLLRMSLFQEKREMEQRGHSETQLIREASYVIGRTSWDQTHVRAVNPKVNYYHCDEILRDEFYDGDIWIFNRCISHSIFLSQGSYPLKGLHIVLEALPLIKQKYPDVRIRVAGPDITYGGAGFKERLKISTYGRIVKDIIKKNNIVDNITFLGALNAEQMKQEYLHANVFVCPSSIENSPNSLGEAQMLGVPCVASYVGGVPDMMKGNEDNLYRFEEKEMLTSKICNVFELGKKINTSNMMEVAKKRHDPHNNLDELLRIYNQIKG